MVTQEYAAWLAGLIDGDGCICISMSLHHYKGTPSFRFNPTVAIKLHERDGDVLRDIALTTGLGRIYDLRWHGSPRPMVNWQTTNLKDLIACLTMVRPYLRIKKVIAERCLEACEILLSRKNLAAAKTKGERSYDLATVLQVARIATSLNDRPFARYPGYKRFEDWEPVLREVYAEPPPKPPRTHCCHGHAWTPETTFVNANGYEECRLCRKETRRRHESKHGLR